MNNLSYPLTLDKIKVKHGEITVIRDDLLLGGTKSRAVLPFIDYFKKQGFNHFVYASPFCGYAQIAIANACKELDVRCSIYAECDPITQEVSDYSLKIKDICDIYLYSSLNAAQNAIPKNNKYSFNIPLGLDHYSYAYFMHIELMKISNELGKIRNIWTSVGTGSFMRSLRNAFSRETKICGLDIHVLPIDDHRLKILQLLFNIEYISANENFSEKRQLGSSLPAPSNDYYDAKVWNWVNQFGKNGDIWWNIAGNV